MNIGSGDFNKAKAGKTTCYKCGSTDDQVAFWGLPDGRNFKRIGITQVLTGKEFSSGFGVKVQANLV
jgi:hypothetical protein